MNGWYLLSVPAYLILIITAVARLADLGADHKSLRHHARRIGLIAVGFVAGTMLVSPFTTDHANLTIPTWRLATLSWGFSLVWLTTEGMPPWWDYILGVHRQAERWKDLPLRDRLWLEYQALRASFKPTRYRTPPAFPGDQA